MAERVHHREQGAALLTVLLLVAIVAVIAATALEKLRLSTRIAGNAGITEQLRSYAQAAEALALARVGALAGTGATRTTLAGGWSDRPFTLPLPGGGTASVRVVDGANCFNLNGLVNALAPGVYQSAPAQRLIFARLMRLTGTPPQVADQVAGSAADWIDTDGEQQGGGAEDATYLSRDPSYRTAGTLMGDPSELRALNGMTPEVYAAVRPWVCTLPSATPAPINVNTLLPEQAPLIAMLLPDTLPVETARRALLSRPAQGYANTAAFWTQSALSSLTSGEAAGQTAVKTAWFALTIDVRLGTSTLEEHALIDATRLPARLATRQWGERS
ncbi:type II secretion system minor pseudopilin GspK [Sphingomonas sp.]|uniref:type II secretion system minor pseudopilin GspK n=1 Tax=Sphingomonas sp. TaxID=28214 RepID=UPI002EDB024C